MIIDLSEQASNVLLDALVSLMDGGSLELQTADGETVAVLNLSNPAAQDASDGEIVFNEIAEDVARMQGVIAMARAVAADGSVLFSCDAGDEDSDAVVKLIGTARIFRGQSVRLNSFRLAMP